MIRRSLARSLARALAAGALAAATASAQEPRVAEEPASLLDSRWELLPASKRGTFRLRPYQPVYLLPWFSTSEPNQTPSSPAPNHSVTEPEGLLDFAVDRPLLGWRARLL